MTTGKAIAVLIRAERMRARRFGIGRDTLPTAREGQLDGYLAGLKRAEKIARGKP